MNGHSERSEESRVTWTRQIEHGWAELDKGTTTRQGFLGWRLEMTAA
jgi:hypothetical protein